LFAQAGELAFEVIDQLAQIAAGCGNAIFAVGKFAEQGGNYDRCDFEEEAGSRRIRPR
jgi:hypothetical protein